MYIYRHSGSYSFEIVVATSHELYTSFLCDRRLAGGKQGYTGHGFVVETFHGTLFATVRSLYDSVSLFIIIIFFCFSKFVQVYFFSSFCYSRRSSDTIAMSRDYENRGGRSGGRRSEGAFSFAASFARDCSPMRATIVSKVGKNGLLESMGKKIGLSARTSWKLPPVVDETGRRSPTVPLSTAVLGQVDEGRRTRRRTSRGIGSCVYESGWVDVEARQRI